MLFRSHPAGVPAAGTRGQTARLVHPPNQPRGTPVQVNARRRLGSLDADARPHARPTTVRLSQRHHPQARLAPEMEKTEEEEEMLWGRRLRTGPLMSASVREKRKWVILSIRIYGIRRTSDTGPKLFPGVYNGVSQTCVEL